MDDHDSVTVRQATVDDAQGIGRVHINSARAAFRGVFPDNVLDGMDFEEREQHWRQRLSIQEQELFVYVADQANHGLIGYVAGGASDSGTADYAGEIFNLYLEPDFQRRGIGRRLIVTCARALEANGYQSVMLWTATANPHAGFYRRLGSLPVATREVWFGNESVEETAFGWKNISVMLEASSTSE
jgi:ribosomal protein S18 acetylase RimI-like enzyme